MVSYYDYELNWISLIEVLGLREVKFNSNIANNNNNNNYNLNALNNNNDKDIYNQSCFSESNALLRQFVAIPQVPRSLLFNAYVNNPPSMVYSDLICIFF